MPKPVAFLLGFFLAVGLLAQEIPVSLNGQTIPQISVPAIYTGKYAMQLSTWGFFWINTETYLAGHVQAITLCRSGFPSSVTGLAPVGDCNSFSAIAASGGVVVAYTTSGLCWPKLRWCSVRDDGHMLIAFKVEDGFPLIGDVDDIPADSPQTTDPQGRKWSVKLTDGTYRNFAWYVTGGSPPPTATPTAVPVPPTATPTGVAPAPTKTLPPCPTYTPTPNCTR